MQIARAINQYYRLPLLQTGKIEDSILHKNTDYGNVKLTYDSWAGFSSPAKLYDLLDGQQFVEIANEKDSNAGNNESAVCDGTNTNWYDYVFRTGIQHSHSLSLAGANARTQYYLSTGYTNRKGVIIANSYDRYTFYGKANHSFLKDHVTAGFSLNASQQNSKGYTAGTNSLSGAMYASLKMLPDVSVYDDTDPTGYNISDDRKSLGGDSNLKPIDLTIPNIMLVLENNNIYNNSWRLLPAANLDIKPVNWLTCRAVLGADVSLVENATVWKPESSDGFGCNGYISKNFAKRQRWNFQNILTLNKDFGVHHVDATAVAEWSNCEYKYFSGGGCDFSDTFFWRESAIGEIINDFRIRGSLAEVGNDRLVFACNFSTQNSKVVTLMNEIPCEFYILREGESINALYGYRYAGVNPASGNPMYSRADNTIVQGNITDSKYYVYDPNNPGDLSFPSNLTADDKAIPGNSIPARFGGWDNILTWKNFDFNIFLRFSGGNKVANITRRDLLNQQFPNNSTEILGRWQSPENPGDRQTPKLWYGRAGFINLDGNGLSRWVEDGKFLKVQNLAIGYSLPASVCRALFIEKARIYVQGQNLLSFTKYSGLDPEACNPSVVPGVDYNSNPQQRTFPVGLNIEF
ncbi:MAG: hypothetical protein LBG45_02135 [Dysgonamonadaceae bacterium]|nr:hypothetical protein [Dysgonamonadaceae bacterium]